MQGEGNKQGEEVWVGLFGVIPAPQSNTLGNSRGAYVNAAAIASHEDEFLGRISVACRGLDLELVESERVHSLENYVSLHGFSDEIQKITEVAFDKSEVAFGTFHTYERDDD